MSETDQLDIISALREIPQQYACPTCRGNKRMLRLLYPDEALKRGVLTEVCTCRTCRGAGWVAWDPDDHSEFPF